MSICQIIFHGTTLSFSTDELVRLFECKLDLLFVQFASLFKCEFVCSCVCTKIECFSFLCVFASVCV